MNVSNRVEYIPMESHIFLSWLVYHTMPVQNKLLLDFESTFYTEYQNSKQRCETIEIIVSHLLTMFQCANPTDVILVSTHTFAKGLLFQFAQ